jgi:hypothetical protein
MANMTDDNKTRTATIIPFKSKMKIKQSDYATVVELGFDFALQEKIYNLQAGDFVKIRRCSERFWCFVRQIKGLDLTVVVRSNLVHTIGNEESHGHGLSYGDIIVINIIEIIDVLTNQQWFEETGDRD